MRNGGVSESVRFFKSTKKWLRSGMRAGRIIEAECSALPEKVFGTLVKC